MTEIGGRRPPASIMACFLLNNDKKDYNYGR